MSFGPVAALIARAAEGEFDPDSVTPGVLGFAFTFLVMVIVVLLIADMVRRIRRVNHRAEVTARLAAEIAERDAREEGVTIEKPRED